MNLIAAIGSDDMAYEIIFFLHILGAIIGFGTVFLNGLYGQQAVSRRGSEGAAISQANLAVSNVAEIFIYSVFVTGLLLGIMAKEGTGIELSDAWLSAAMLLFIIGLGISHGVLRPSVKKLDAALAADAATDARASVSPDPAAPETSIDELGKKVAAAGGIENVIFVVILVLMVWKPGAGLG